MQHSSLVREGSPKCCFRCFRAEPPGSGRLQSLLFGGPFGRGAAWDNSSPQGPAGGRDGRGEMGKRGAWTDSAVGPGCGAWLSRHIAPCALCFRQFGRRKTQSRLIDAGRGWSDHQSKSGTSDRRWLIADILPFWNGLGPINTPREGGADGVVFVTRVGKILKAQVMFGIAPTFNSSPLNFLKKL